MKKAELEEEVGPRPVKETARQEWAPWLRQEEQFREGKLDGTCYLKYFNSSLF